MGARRVMKKKLGARFWSDERGAAAIELALISALILAPLLLGATELGRRIWMRSQLDNVWRVGMEYVMINGARHATDIHTSPHNTPPLRPDIPLSPPSPSSPPPHT